MPPIMTLFFLGSTHTTRQSSRTLNWLQSMVDAPDAEWAKCWAGPTAKATVWGYARHPQRSKAAAKKQMQSKIRDHEEGALPFVDRGYEEGGITKLIIMGHSRGAVTGRILANRVKDAYGDDIEVHVLVYDPVNLSAFSASEAGEAPKDKDKVQHLDSYWEFVMETEKYRRSLAIRSLELTWPFNLSWDERHLSLDWPGGHNDLAITNKIGGKVGCAMGYRFLKARAVHMKAEPRASDEGMLELFAEYMKKGFANDWHRKLFATVLPNIDQNYHQGILTRGSLNSRRSVRGKTRKWLKQTWRCDWTKKVTCSGGAGQCTVRDSVCSQRIRGCE